MSKHRSNRREVNYDILVELDENDLSPEDVVRFHGSALLKKLRQGGLVKVERGIVRLTVKGQGKLRAAIVTRLRRKQINTYAVERADEAVAQTQTRKKPGFFSRLVFWRKRKG